MNKPAFIRNDQGLYRVRGTVSPDEIINAAAGILLEGLKELPTLTSPEASAQFLQLSLAQELNEHFCGLFLDNRHRVLAFERLASGTLDGASVYPRVVLQRALEHNAAAVIFAHNHPSDNCEPSQADRRITERLRQALALVDIRVLDHFVVGRSSWVSFAERGWL